ncbi:hypothetical protein AB0230_12255 [Microbacterium sp. NPDC089190]|uniref:hypothetical protein n=1 Tax=Microbacterium sp. NPDC089190 TaxID=3155063 RepID=UPI00344B6E01
MTPFRKRWTDGLDASLLRLGRGRALLLVATALVMGAIIAAFALSTLAQIAAGDLQWTDAVGSGRRRMPAMLVVGIGGPVAVLFVVYGVGLAGRLVCRWPDIPARRTR